MPCLELHVKTCDNDVRKLCQLAWEIRGKKYGYFSCDRYAE